MRYAITQKQSESPSSSSVGPSPVLSGPLGVALTPSQSAPVKSSEGVLSIAQQAQLPCRARPQGRGRAWTSFQNGEAQLPPPLPPPLPLRQNCVCLTLIGVRLPLLLTFASASFLLFGLCLRPVRHRVQLSGFLKDSKQDKGQSTDLRQNRMDGAIGGE